MQTLSPGDVMLADASIAINRGELASAETLLVPLLAIQPNHAMANYLLGATRLRQGRYRDAQALYSLAISNGCHTGPCFNEYGLVSYRLGDVERAEESYGYALQVAPGDAAALNNLGNLYRSTGRAALACECYRKALEARPNAPDLLTNLGIALRGSGNAAEGKACFERAIALAPWYLPAYNSLAILLRESDALDEALEVCSTGLLIDPGHVELLNTQAVCLFTIGEVSAADASVCKAIETQGEYWTAWDNRLMFSLYRDDLSSEQVDALHAAWASRFEEVIARSGSSPSGSVPTERAPGGRLRVGLVSADFRRHPVAQFVEPLLKAIDPAAIELFAYACQGAPDDVTERLKGFVGHWRDVAALHDAEIVERVRADRIDVLFDLAGHTADNRLGVFARRAAPVQVSYLGYAHATGLSTIDYRLVDAVTDPPAPDSGGGEKRIRLDRCFLCYAPPRGETKDMPAFGAPPASARGYLTFGSFNHLAKISPTLMKLWTGIAREIPESVFVIKSRGGGSKRFRERMLSVWRAAGLAEDRLQMLGHDADYRGHLDRYRTIDVALDTYPYNGTTTTCDALWMGVPVVTFAGQTHASRVGASLLQSCGHPELVARSGEEYVRIAVALARDRYRLGALHRELRHDLAASPMMDSEAFGRAFLEGLRRVLRHGEANS